MKGTQIKQKYIELLLDINVGRIALKYFGKSPSWLYHKLDGRDGNGKPTDFTPEELEIFQGALCDLAYRLRTAAADMGSEQIQYKKETTSSSKAVAI